MSKTFRIRLAIGLISALFLNTGFVHATPMTASQSPAAHIAQQLAQQYPEISIEQVPFNSPHLAWLIGERIDARLLENAPIIQGTDFQLVRPNPKHAVAVLTLSYSTPAIALLQATRLSTHGMYFHNTKILTPFRYALVDNTLVIVFTESGLEDLIEDIVKTLGMDTTSNSPLHEPQ